MDLKPYQNDVVETVERFLARVAAERAEGNTKHAALDAWGEVIGGPYHERRNGLGEDMPNFVVKVPTGGGKTVIATQLLGSLYRTILEDRRGAGLVLWVVPSSQIYRDTIKRLTDREDWYRKMLEHAISRRIEVWEKGDIAQLTPAKLRDCLNILVIQLASTNRETREQLKFFRDSGGNIVQHFPPEDEPEKHKTLKDEFPNLTMVEDDADRGRHLAATSIGNLVRISRPAVVIDEGHRATSRLARETIEDFNAAAVVELSATPRAVRNKHFEYHPNVIVRVTGQQLLDEHMIKLPLNIMTSALSDWKDVLTKARDKRQALAKAAETHALAAGMAHRIRPLVLVQVERTGRDQRDAKHIHSEDVREYLHRLGVPAQAVKVKTSEMDELSDVDNLMDPDCPVQWIITKSALQEGWDCPFAYILVSLDNTGTETAMTQLIGRILRQPYQQRTPQEELNESYVYCLRSSAGQIARQVKTALEREGYEGDTSGLVTTEGEDGTKAETRQARIRDAFSSLYTHPFEGKIYLPHFCVKTGDEYEPLDWYRHLLSEVDETKFDYASIDWRLAEELAKAKDRFYRMTLGDDGPSAENEVAVDHHESDVLVMSWIVATLGYDYLSFKQLKRIVRAVYDQLLQREMMLEDRIDLVKFVVRDHIRRFIDDQIDRQCEQTFANLFKQGRLRFYLECAECRFEIPDCVDVKRTRHFVRDDNSPIRNSLFDYVDESAFDTETERAVALYLDDHPQILWWYRNLIGEEHFAIQGYRRDRVRPDFVAQSKPDGRTLNQVVVVESKGDQLAGNADTTYKKKMADYFERVGKQVPWHQLSEDFKDHQFRFQVITETQEHGRDWRDEIATLLQPTA